MDLSGAAVVLDGSTNHEGHDICKIYKEMREKCENPDVDDKDLWKEWKQHGKEIEMNTQCICGVNIVHCYTMKNVLNGNEIFPIGCVCIKKAIGNFYRCQDCQRKFVDIKNGALNRRMREYDFICNDCLKERKERILKCEIKLFQLNEQYKNFEFGGQPFSQKTKRDYDWASTRPCVGKIRHFMDYWEDNQYWSDLKEKYNSRKWSWNFKLNSASKIK